MSVERPAAGPAAPAMHSAAVAIRVLILEDRPADAELMIRGLRRSNFDPAWERAETEAEFLAGLAKQPDVILADYRMPQMDAARALELLRDSGFRTPFIVVSGAIGEDVAVAMMRKGASDYLLKDRLARLGPAVRRVLDERALEERTRRTSEELRASELRFQSFMSNSPALARIKDADGRLLYMNATCERLTGLSLAECAGKTDRELWPPDVAERLRAKDLAVLVSGESSRSVEDITLRDGRTLQLLTFRFLVYDAAGRPMLGETSSDIGEQMRTQKALAEALAAKEVLFREVHHRVKNNLQLVSSLLSMQAESLKNSAAGPALMEAHKRIQCMALVHERLNDRGEADRIDFREYASTLAHDLMFAYGAAGGAVRMRLDLHSVTLDLNRAIPCGLILNELITNSLKYAFPDGRRGEIRVSLSAGADGLVTMEVADDGVGLPAGFDWRSSTSLGLRIVDILSRQIDGAVAVGGASGASFVLKFPQAPERRQEAVAGGGGS